MKSVFVCAPHLFSGSKKILGLVRFASHGWVPRVFVSRYGCGRWSGIRIARTTNGWWGIYYRGERAMDCAFANGEEIAIAGTMRFRLDGAT